MSAGLKFPDMPRLHMTYYAVQFEPMIHSGERLTIVLVLQADGVKPVVSVPLLMMCKHARVLLRMVKIMIFQGREKPA